jgi:hypothetical protein
MIVWRSPKPSTIKCVVTTVIICGFLYFYGRPIALLLTKWQVRNKPELWIVPTPLPSVASEPTPGRTFSYLGYEFESPWTKVKLEKKYRSIAIVYFSDGEFISISKGPDIIGAMQERVPKRRGTLRDVFGAGVMGSNYVLRSSILNSTPRDLRLFSSPREMVTNSVLLMLKPISVIAAKSGLYSFQSQSVRGFEEGTPGQANPVKIDAFDDKDREVDLLIGTQLHKRYGLTSGHKLRSIFTTSRTSCAGMMYELRSRLTGIPPTGRISMSRFGRLTNEFLRKTEDRTAAEAIRLRKSNPKLRLIGIAIGIIVVSMLALWMAPQP